MPLYLNCEIHNPLDWVQDLAFEKDLEDFKKGEGNS